MKMTPLLSHTLIVCGSLKERVVQLNLFQKNALLLTLDV